MIDQEILTEIQYALLELPDGEPDGGASWPSEVWRREEVLQALNDSQAAVVRDTRVLTAYVEQAVLTDARSVSLPSDWLASAHLVFRTEPQGVRRYLHALSAVEADLGASGWETARGLPYGYIDGATHTLEIQLVPTPSQDGTLEHLYVPQPGVLDGNGQTLDVPEIAASAVKYRTLETLLSGAHRLQDPERAAYCRDRAAVVVAALQALLLGGL